MAELTPVYGIASDYVDGLARLHPIAATSIGVPGFDDRMTDFSPAGEEQRVAHSRAILQALDAAEVTGDRDRVAKEAMEERLRLNVELHESGDYLRDLSILGSPLQSIRSTFDLMPRETEQDWRNVATRLALVPEALAGLRASLEEGLARDLRASQRQALACALQAEAWSGQREGTPSFFETLLDAYDGSTVDSDGLRSDLAEGARLAADGYAAIGEYLRERYAARAEQRDPVGADRYALNARAYTGATLDLRETYEWGWEELRRIERELVETAARVVPGGGVAEARERLESDPALAIEGVDEFQRWMQELQDSTIAEMNGVHFDIPEPVRRIEAMIAPPGGALAMYYTGPSEDFSRPGRTWYPTGGKTRFPLWFEVSVAFHEGVPGHHLQIAMVKYNSDELSRFQRLTGTTSGYAEGWALYSERLMAELGYLDDPGHYFGMLVSQAFRAARVVVDIGMHLEFTVPGESELSRDVPAGVTWTPELALRFMSARNPFGPDFIASEIDRYLGIPGQAISYKVGERYWLEAREAARARDGEAFDLKAWHARSLDAGPMGLDQLKRELGG